MNYAHPDRVQALGGGSYNKWFATTRHVGESVTFDDCVDQEKIEGEIDYVVGASMLVTKKFINKIGMMNEEYFLYFEELDWSVRAQHDFSLAYAANSLVFHKEGQSIGSSPQSNKKSIVSDYYGVRNRFIFTKKYYRWAIVTVYLSAIGIICNRIFRRQWERIPLLLNAIFRPQIIRWKGADHD